MGFSLSWAAVKDGMPQAVQEVLALHSTGAREEIPESDVTGAELPGGWYLIVSNHDGLQLTKDAVLRRLSQVGEVVMCLVEEHVMCSFAAGWREGRSVWSVLHDAQAGIEHLDVTGELPAPFGCIRDRLQAEQAAAGGKNAGVDYIFDIPVQLAHTLTGYQHDVDIPELSQDAFEVLVSANLAQERRSWWKKLTGR